MEDRLRPEQHVHRQRAALSRSIRVDVHPHSTWNRARLDRAGLGPRVRSPADLRRVEPVTYADLGDGSAALVQPTAESLRRHGPLGARVRLVLADVVGRRAAFVHDHLDPAYKPVLWLRQGALDVGSSADDLERLGDLGRQMLRRAGIRGSDHLVSVTLPEPDLGFWQVALGCRAGGVPALHLGSGAVPADLVEAEPTVIAGPVEVLARLARGVAEPLPTVRTVVAWGRPLPARGRAALGRLGVDAAVVAAWAPAGVRAMWSECRHAALHTWPEAEVIEVLDPNGEPSSGIGEIVWTAVGWRGTVALRLRTELTGRLVTGPCACSATTPRLEVGPLASAPA